MNGPLYAGIDAGSSATKCVVIDAAGTLVGHAVSPSGFSYSDAAEGVLESALTQAGARVEDVASCVSTGYGRESVSRAKRHVTEISCHAKGTLQSYPDIRHIIDIGGQDTKVIWINDQGQLADFKMNAKCAAGTGTFLETIATRLGKDLKEIDELALQSKHTSVVNSFCTVFAGTEVLERIKAGQSPGDISRGLFQSIATRVMEMLGTPNGPVCATGGVVAHCKSMVLALEDVFQTQIVLPPLPQHAGAHGAALLASSDSGVADHVA